MKTQERIAKRKLADIKDSVKTTQEAIKRHESADSTSWMLPELKKQLELHKKDAQSAQQTLESIQQKIKEQITKEKPSDESARHSYFNPQSPNILHSNEIWGGGLAGGTLNGLETDEDGNIIGFNPAKFVAGFIAGAGGTKAVKLAMKNPSIRAKAERFVAQSGEFIKNELQNSDLPRHARHALENALGKTLTRALDNKLFIMPAGENAVKKEIVKEIANAKALQKEQKGIYNVTFNGKNATLIKKDLSRIDDALQNTLSFQKGYHNAAKDKGKGAEHIKIHLKEQEEGFITQSELLNLGKSVREYLAEFKEPFIDKNGARIYEWFDENGVKFRLVVDNPKGSGTSSPSLPLSDDDIIIYFSDRFSNKGIKFYNSKVDSAYESFFSNKVETASKELDKLDNAFSQLRNAPFYKDIDIYEISYKMPLRYLYDKAKSGNSIAKEILENFSTGFEGRGYSGYSMSNNAVAAYENGHKPLSKFTKEDADELSDLFAEKWSVKEIKDLVKNYGEVGYHHTSKFYNNTNFYSIAQAFRNIAEYEEDYLKKLIKNIPAPEQSKKDIDDFLSYVKKQDELREQLDKEIHQKRKEFFEFRSKLERNQYIKQRDEQLKREKEIEKERELKRAAYLKAFEAKKPLAQNFMEYLEKIGWYQNPEKHALNKERYLNDELEKALQIYEWLNNKTYLKSLDELKADGFSGTQRYYLGRLKHFEKDLKAYFGDESVDKDKLKNLGIMSSKNKKETKMLSNVVSDDKINYAHLKNIAQELKEVKDETEFYALFGFKNGKTRGNVKTPIKEVEIDLQEAWQHLQDNSKKENRLKLAGGILPTLQTPNVVSVDKNGTYFFYKAFKDEKGVLNLVSVELPKSNRLQYKTSYIASKQRLLKIFNEYEVIYEKL